MFSSPTVNRRALIGNEMDSSFNHSRTEFGQQDDTNKPGFLFGNKRRSVNVNGQTQYSNSPASGPSAPSSDIFASPVPSAVPHHMKDCAPGSGKSVHWSPALVQEKSHTGIASSPIIKTGSVHAQNFSSPAISAPPLRSLRDEVEPVKKAARRSLSVPVNHHNSSTNAMDQQSSPLLSDAETWVTVFGFPPEQASNILKYFSRHGEVVAHQIPVRGNWMHLRYSCGIHARQAISRNATVLDGSLRIGVVPCTEKDLVGSESASARAPGVLNRSNLAEQSIREEMEEDERDVSIPALSNRDQNVSILDNSMNTSRLSIASRSGMRSLSSAYDSNKHAHAKSQPTKQDTLMNKLWNAVGF